MVEEELNTEVKDDINAASITASMSPRTPAGSSSLTSWTKAKLVQPDLKVILLEEEIEAKILDIAKSEIGSYFDPQISSHCSGPAQATLSGKSTLEAIPGNRVAEAQVQLGYNF